LRRDERRQEARSEDVPFFHAEQPGDPLGAVGRRRTQRKTDGRQPRHGDDDIDPGRDNRLVIRRRLHPPTSRPVGLDRQARALSPASARHLGQHITLQPQQLGFLVVLRPCHQDRPAGEDRKVPRLFDRADDDVLVGERTLSGPQPCGCCQHDGIGAAGLPRQRFEGGRFSSGTGEGHAHPGPQAKRIGQPHDSPVAG